MEKSKREEVERKALVKKLEDAALDNVERSKLEGQLALTMQHLEQLKDEREAYAKKSQMGFLGRFASGWMEEVEATAKEGKDLAGSAGEFLGAMIGGNTGLLRGLKRGLLG
jgi:CRISPR/Cas system-associated endoribonuclease Cas2